MFSFSISAPTIEQANQMKSQLDAAIEANELSFPAIRSMSLNAFIDPTVPVSLNTTASGVYISFRYFNTTKKTTQ